MRSRAGESGPRVAAALLLSIGGLVACDPTAPIDTAAAPGESVAAPEGSADDGSEPDRLVRKLCSTCHRLPPPEILPRARWDYQVRKMFEIATGGSETPIEGYPRIEDAIEYFQRRAPEKLRPIVTTSGKGPGPLKLRRVPLRLDGIDPYPAVASVRMVRFPGSAARDLLVSDMRYGFVLRMRPGSRGRAQVAHLLGRVPHPCRVELTDLDRDGVGDLLVANLGTPTPSDVTQGSVEWLRGIGPDRYRKVTLVSGLGRVADVRSADFDGDGDLDVLVGEFGWRKVGSIFLLENETAEGGESGKLRFRRRLIDPRPGSIHVPVVDLDRDGRPDFIALLSQQFETVVAYLNRGGCRFEERTIFEAPHPNWGSSGIEVVDFDGDGDLDVVYANGDTLDDMIVKPYHGIQWLENRGSFPFVHHRLLDLYGVHYAKTGDLDGDGDLDIVACTFLPFLSEKVAGAKDVEALIWLEQKRPGVFERWSIESFTCDYPTIDVGDLDGDGDLDIVVGSMTMGKGEEDTLRNWVFLHENLRIP